MAFGHLVAAKDLIALEAVASLERKEKGKQVCSPELQTVIAKMRRKGHWKDECPNKPKDAVNMVTQVTSPPGLKHYVNKNDDRAIFEEIPEEVFTVIEEKTIEELSQSMMLEKPTEQTLEEFAEVALHFFW